MVGFKLANLYLRGTSRDFTFVDKDQAEEIPCRVFLIDIAECRRQVKSAEEQANRDCLSWNIQSARDSECFWEGGQAYLWRENRPLSGRKVM